MAGDAVELVMCIGVRKYIGLDGMAVLTGLADDGLIATAIQVTPSRLLGS